MISRSMRMIVMFDLPTLTSEDKRNYRKFHKFLHKNGFIMMTESVYCKLIINGTASDLMETKVMKNTPPSGNVQLLIITEKQYSKIKYLVGEKNSKILDSEDRVIIL